MGWFNNLKLAIKILLGFIFVAIIAGVVGVVGLINLREIEEDGQELYNNMTVPLSIAAEMSKNFQSIRVSTRDMVLEDNLAEINGHYNRIQQTIKIINDLANEFDDLILSDKIQNAFNDYLMTRGEYDRNLEQLLVLARENRDEEALALINGQMRIASDAQQSALDYLVQLKVEDAKSKSEDNTRIANRAIALMFIVILIGLIISILLGLYISRLISKPIGQIVDAAKRIAKGDLNIELNINSKDEVGILAVAFEEMANNIDEVMSNISVASEQVATGSKQMSDSSMSLSQGATEQASSIEELTASLEEISSQTNHNAESANEANVIAETAKENAINGNEQMKNMLKAMEEINSSSTNISKIIKVIDEIAFQTNILALNAAVEAARAGQHGKGFAVVAEEVRNLAARSADAAKETTAMIEGSISKVEDGTKIATDTAGALDKIVDGVAKVANIVADIAIASNEQASGISQVNQAIMQVSEVVQSNSATSEESAAASEELAGQAELLKEQVGRFTLRRKQSGNKGYSNLNEMNPEVFKKLEEMKVKRNGETVKETERPKKIVLSDNEFGKY
jgi:methyl-accepting chemotaxis protein